MTKSKILVALLDKAGEKTISIEKALSLKESLTKQEYKLITMLCPECQQSLRAHKVGRDGHPAHFEHNARNPNCKLSHVWIPAKTVRGTIKQASDTSKDAIKRKKTSV